jgi:RimJ/RimL family protein N-acetyltransferase
MHVEPVTLSGRVVRLEPLAAFHAADLYAAAAPELFRLFYSGPTEFSQAGFEAYIAALRARAGWLPFAQVLAASGRAIGVTAYLNISERDRGLEIGSTWISPAHQGTAVNPEAKFLLLRHAFETLGVIRVQLKTDSRNLHSQRAIEKLGAVKEGVLRNHIIMPDGHIRHSVMYSILPDEWPDVQARLGLRLGYTP